MPDITVDLGFFIFTTIVAVFAVPFIIGLIFWKSYKNPEFWLKVKRQGWVRPKVWTPEGKLQTVVYPLKKIGENGEMTLFGNRRYFWIDRYKGEHNLTDDKYKKDNELPSNAKILPQLPVSKPDTLKDGLPTVFQEKGKPTALFEWDDPFPQVRVPGGSLHSMTNPRILDEIGAATDFKLMLKADDLLKLQRLAMMISIIGVIAVIGLAYAVYAQSSSTNHLSCILLAGNNDTLARACH